jgi:hypothetical protein
MRIRYSIALLLVVVTLAIFWQIRNHEFVWSDCTIVVEDLNQSRSKRVTQKR